VSIALPVLLLSRSGLDVMLEKYIHEVENLLSTPLSNASLANPSFKYIWEVSHH
jgi:hypothetical protein